MPKRVGRQLSPRMPRGGGGRASGGGTAKKKKTPADMSQKELKEELLTKKASNKRMQKYWKEKKSRQSRIEDLPASKRGTAKKKPSKKALKMERLETSLGRARKKVQAREAAARKKKAKKQR